ncbi:MAG: hypothetical protein WCP85_07855 [Mariniphaga sp.]
MKCLEIQLILSDKTISDKVIGILKERFKNLFTVKNLKDVVRYSFTIVKEIQTDAITGKYAPITTFEIIKTLYRG